MRTLTEERVQVGIKQELRTFSSRIFFISSHVTHWHDVSASNSILRISKIFEMFILFRAGPTKSSTALKAILVFWRAILTWKDYVSVFRRFILLFIIIIICLIVVDMWNMYTIQPDSVKK